MELHIQVDSAAEAILRRAVCPVLTVKTSNSSGLIVRHDGK